MKAPSYVEHGWGKPFWGAIGLYIASLLAWVIIIAILLEMHLKDPVRLVAIFWGISYPFTLIIGLVSATVAYFMGTWKTYIHALLFPLYVTLLALVIASMVGGYAQLERNWARNDWRSDVSGPRVQAIAQN